MVNITVPYADENRDRVLLEAWERQGRDDLPAPPLRLPRHSEGSYRIHIRQRALHGLLVEDQYSDAVAGRTGGLVDHRADGIVVHLTVRGAWRFSSPRDSFAVGAGLLMVRNNESPWDFEIDRGTTSLVLQLPGDDLGRTLLGGQAFMVDQDAPAARLLLGFVRHWSDLSPGLSPEAGRSAGVAGRELVRGLLSGLVAHDEEFAPALTRAAMDWIEDRLLTDLDPSTVAKHLNVSVRTLHRAFSNEGTSVMGFVRERRLDRARAELSSSSLTISEVAARWQFADSSHFSKSYRKRFGDSPSADRRRPR